MKIYASLVCHTGYRRERNEDNFCFNRITMSSKGGSYAPCGCNDSNRGRSVLLGVFDGMGGYSAGDRASAISADVAAASVETLRVCEDVGAELETICNKANAAICEAMQNEDIGRMGSTAALLCFRKGRYYLCNIGDSPVFLFRDLMLTEISHEHTEKERYIQIHGEENLPKNKKYRLTQHLGIYPEEMEIEPYTHSDELRRGDKFILCSDGLTDMVSNEDILKVISKDVSTMCIAKELLERALANGGKDNITIIVAQVGEIG